jgi:hypothetical protein
MLCFAAMEVRDLNQLLKQALDRIWIAYVLIALGVAIAYGLRP